MHISKVNQTNIQFDTEIYLNQKPAKFQDLDEGGRPKNTILRED